VSGVVSIPARTGASFTAVTVKVAGSVSNNDPGSVALKVIVSLPVQSAFDIEIVAILDVTETVRFVLPVQVHVIWASVLSTSDT